MEVTLRLEEGEQQVHEGVVTAERHGYGTVGVRLTFRDGHSEVVPDARIIRADEPSGTFEC